MNFFAEAVKKISRRSFHPRKPSIWWNALNAGRGKCTNNFPCSPNPLPALQRRPRLLAVDTQPAGVAVEVCVRATNPSGLRLDSLAKLPALYPLENI
jgi:hypothetical protein